MTDREELFTERGLSPRRVMFYLTHWQSLRSIAEGARDGRGELDALRREWEIINTDATIMGVCACNRRGFYRSTPEEYTGGGSFGPADNEVSDLLAELERVADLLPVHWDATLRVMIRQTTREHRRDRDCLKRRAAWLRAGNALGDDPEPPDSEYRVIGMMARATGWRPQGSLDAARSPPPIKGPDHRREAS